MSRKLHAPGPSGQPVCGRNLCLDRFASSPTGEAKAYNIGTSRMELATGEAKITCRHCLRKLGLLPALTRSRDAEGEIEEPNDESEAEHYDRLAEASEEEGEWV
jgi:hypothetical protein